MNKIFTKLTAVLLFLVGSINMVSAQKALKIGGANPFKIEPSAVLEVASTNRGFLPPRVQDEKKSFPDKTSGVTPAVAYGPEKGLVVYNTTRNELLVNVGTDGASKWFSIVAASPKSSIRTVTSAVADDKKVGVADNTIICDTSGGNITLTLPDPAKSEGRILVISKIDDSTNSLIFSADITNPSSFTGLKIGEQTTTSLNYPKKPFRIQSNKTDWIVIDDDF